MDLEVDLTNELIIISKLILSLILGGFIGYDREKHGKEAGVRTYAAVCMGATIFTSIAEHLTDTEGASRVIANIIVGIGFLGAGIITRDNMSNASQGLTTAATVWCTAGIGVSIGMNMFIIGIFSSAVLYFLLALHYRKWYRRWMERIAGKNKMDNSDSTA
jgi:putative Mg2+ transporter-C (MgtC) family protein